MNLITYQHSGAYLIQVQPTQKKKRGLRHTLHLSTNLIQWKLKSARNFTTKLNKDKAQRKKTSSHKKVRFKRQQYSRGVFVLSVNLKND